MVFIMKTVLDSRVGKVRRLEVIGLASLKEVHRQ